MSNNVVKSICYLECVNKITSLVNELLYSADKGYIYLKSRDAIFGFEKVIERFDNESLKLCQNLNYSDVDEVVQTKRNKLIFAIQKHYDEQIPIWADSVFDEMVENCLFELSLNKEKSDEIYKALINAINWVCDIKNSPKDIYKILLEEYTKKFNVALNEDDKSYISNLSAKKTDVEEFLKLWNLILENCDEFVQLNFFEPFLKLSAKDAAYFHNLKTALLTYRKNSTVDEISLISTAIDILNLEDANLKYGFIIQINNDFKYFMEQNKTLKEGDKINLIKRRVELFSDENKKVKNYFRKLITF